MGHYIDQTLKYMNQVLSFVGICEEKVVTIAKFYLGKFNFSSAFVLLHTFDLFHYRVFFLWIWKRKKIFGGDNKFETNRVQNFLSSKSIKFEKYIESCLM